jgi:hypothetical protein
MNLMTKHRWLGRALGAALLTAPLGACDSFIDVGDTNPNAVPTASADQLFVGAQVNTFVFSEGQISRLASMWMQQMAGTDRQFSSLDVYQITESTVDGEFAQLYAQGGLLNLREAMAQVQDRKGYLGILQVHEAFLIGMGASVWGDIPYSQAGDPSNPAPTLDKQEQVYAAVQKLLDDAIANLRAGGGAPSTADLNFGGNTSKWIEVANTLKARFYMHWVEAQLKGSAAAGTACGGNCLDKAIAAAQNGIRSNASSFRAIHGSGAKENNFWYQFLRDRSGYIAAGEFGVDLLKTRKDPRLPFYYSKAPKLGDFVGSPPGAPKGDPGTDASSLSNTGYGSPTFNFPIATCAENSFILAEAQFRKGNTAAAQAALRQGVACEEARLGVSDIPVNASLTGPGLLREIITQKYIALFLNMETWSDYKRTCLPSVTPFSGATIPGRLFYGQTEAQTNSNIPAADKQPARNTNDPDAC